MFYRTFFLAAVSAAIMSPLAAAPSQPPVAHIAFAANSPEAKELQEIERSDGRKIRWHTQNMLSHVDYLMSMEPFKKTPSTYLIFETGIKEFANAIADYKSYIASASDLKEQIPSLATAPDGTEFDAIFTSFQQFLTHYSKSKPTELRQATKSVKAAYTALMHALNGRGF